MKRSTRSFLTTLTNFQVLERISPHRFRQAPKLMLKGEWDKESLKLYALAHHSQQIHLVHLDHSLFVFYRTPDLPTIALTYHLTE